MLKKAKPALAAGSSGLHELRGGAPLISRICKACQGIAARIVLNALIGMIALLGWPWCPRISRFVDRLDQVIEGGGHDK